MRLILLLASCLAVAASSNTCETTPSSKNLGDITILLENDLDYNTPKFSTLLLSNAQTHAAAQNACACLGETLATVDSSQIPSLAAQLAENSASGLFWLSDNSSNNKYCSAFDSHGARIVKEHCLSRLPSICTNAAKPWTLLNQDTSKTISVDTDLGPIVGFRDNQVFHFTGIPYAEPAVRFSRAVEKKQWVDPLNATAYGAPCIQFNGRTPQTNSSDDCLFLNIYTPVLPEKPKHLKPVMLWIYGGGFTIGEADVLTFHGQNLASRGDVIFVSFNYRLNIFAFYLDEANDAPGNLAISDQVLALEWTRQNIARFGGDPEKITIFGESAGASSVHTHLISPYSKGKFRAAISESDPIGYGYWSKNTTLQISSAFLSQLKCSDIECARNASWINALVAGQVALGVVETSNLQADKGEPWNPYKDGDLIPTEFSDAAKDGNFFKVPLMWTTNHDEEGYFVAPSAGNAAELSDGVTPPNSTDNFVTLASQKFFQPNQVPDIVKSGLYPYHINDTTPPNPYAVMDAMTDLLTDFIFVCPGEEIVSSLVEHVPVYKGIFFQRPSGIYTNTTQLCYNKVCHTDELFFVMGLFSEFQGYNFQITAEDLALSREIVDRWSSFAKTLSPNTGNYTHWPEAGSDLKTLQIQNTSPESVITKYRSAQCTFLQNTIKFDFITYPA